jgi:hypothetical protein
MQSKEELLKEIHELNRQYEEAYEENRALLAMVGEASKGGNASELNELSAKRANAKRKFDAIAAKRQGIMDKLHRLYGRSSIDYTE